MTWLKDCPSKKTSHIVCSAYRENPFRYLCASFGSVDSRRVRVSHKEQLLTALQLSVTAAHTAFCKKYLTVLNRAQIFAYRRTCTTSELLEKLNQTHESWVRPEHQRPDSPLAQNEVVGPMYALPMGGWREGGMHSNPGYKIPSAQLLQSMKK